MFVKRIYLAARYSKHPQMQEYASDLMNLGLEITSRWIWGNHQVPDTVKGNAAKILATQFAQEDVDDVMQADRIIIFTDPVRSVTRGGKFFELGIAYAEDKDIIVIGDENENIFYHLPEFKKFPTWKAYLETITEKPHENSNT